MNITTLITAIFDAILRNHVGNGIAQTAAWVLLLAAVGVAGQPATVTSYHDPAELVRKAVKNEVNAANDDTARFLFRGVKSTPKGSTTRIYVETKDVTAGLVIAYNGNHLTPEQQKDEEARVERFVINP